MSVDFHQPSAPAALPNHEAPPAFPLASQPCESPLTGDHLGNGARIICSDKRSSTVLCAWQGEWSVWDLGQEGKTLRGRYFKHLRDAAIEYAERIVGHNLGEPELE